VLVPIQQNLQRFFVPPSPEQSLDLVTHP
jgi:hypothetical protein